MFNVSSCKYLIINYLIQVKLMLKNKKQKFVYSKIDELATCIASTEQSE